MLPFEGGGWRMSLGDSPPAYGSKGGEVKSLPPISVNCTNRSEPFSHTAPYPAVWVCE